MGVENFIPKKWDAGIQFSLRKALVGAPTVKSALGRFGTKSFFFVRFVVNLMYLLTTHTTVQIVQHVLNGLLVIDGFVTQHIVHALPQPLVILIG